MNGEAFNVTVYASDASGNPPNEVVNIDVYAFDVSNGSSILLGSGSTSLGTGSVTISCNPITGTQNQNATRLFRVKDAYGDYTDYSIPIWFKVDMTVFCFHQTNNQGYGDPVADGGGTRCEGQLAQKSSFVALPSTTVPCGKSILVQDVDTGSHLSTTYEDVGPETTTDPYWNSTGVPQYQGHGIDGSDLLWDNLGLSAYYNCSVPSGTRPVYWRFN